jgi:hypothetical protein
MERDIDATPAAAAAGGAAAAGFYIAIERNVDVKKLVGIKGGCHTQHGQQHSTASLFAAYMPTAAPTAEQPP